MDVFSLKRQCLGIGKRQSWHLERILNKGFNVHQILESLEYISYPVRIRIRDQEKLSKLI